MDNFSHSQKGLIDALKRGDLTAARAYEKDGVLNFDVLQKSLHEALSRADAPIVSYLLGFKLTEGEAKPQLFSKSRRGESGWVFTGESVWSSLFDSELSMSKGFRECAEMLLKEDLWLGVPLSLNGDPKDQERPLHRAVRLGDLALVKRMLEKGAPANGHAPGVERSYNKPCSVSPLTVAVSRGRGEIALALLGAGANQRQDTLRLSDRAAVAFAGAAREWASFADKRLAMRIAFKIDGWEKALSANWGSMLASPQDSLQTLEIWLARKALEVESLGPKGRVGAPKTEEPLPFFSRLTARFRKEQPPAVSIPQPIPSITPLQGALDKLADSDARGFGEEMAYLNSPQRVEALLCAWAMAKSAFWRMPMPGGVGDDGRDASSWGCFKAAAAALEPANMDEPIEGMGGLSLMALASALGHSDVCSTLADAGASLNPHPLLENAAPLALAIRFGQSSLAQSLLDAGADPLEGFKIGAFDLPQRRWAVHEALLAKDIQLIQRAFEIAPQSALLKNSDGDDALRVCDKALSGELGEDETAFYQKARALAQAALIQAHIAEPAREPTARRSAL